MGVSKLTLIARCATACASLAGAPSAHAEGTFDGGWNVTLTCPASAQGARGYTYRFPVEIQESVLHGEHGVRETGGWLTLDGSIEPDGSATLIAQGLANAPASAKGRTSGSTPYRYTVNVQLDATSGSGTRASARKCEYAFVRD
ncbi:hypothetical protein [Paraburkholderia unamae]|uniref:Uncharacterized protein n=1 Tax=Paraburkholderia unamae TaxID=219649 RepID=A0ABX5KA07_9BURK|nr:hypothetical protein [Paraburkholderia unamae]PVX71618.1 hypothetical protein C7402_12841 [Paraburkholderia unamae]